MICCFVSLVWWWDIVECVMVSLTMLFVFFFKQKTAYEMRISDWSSDVCSSDLPHCLLLGRCEHVSYLTSLLARAHPCIRHTCQIGRASCRERVCQYV